MLRMPVLLAGVAVTILTCASISCAATGSTAPDTASNPAFAIGVPLPLSGPRATLGAMMKAAVEMAMEDVNREGAINGSPLTVIFADDGGKVGTAGNVVTKLARDSKVAMLLGGASSDPTYAMAKIAEQMNVPFLVSTASADKITREGWDNIYRMNPPVSEYANSLQDFWLKNVRPKSMAIFYENSRYGTNGAFQMMRFCQENDIEVHTFHDYDKTKADSAHFEPVLAPLAKAPPDVIYMISYLEDGAALVKEARRLKIKSLLCGAAGGFTQQKFIEKAGAAAERLVSATLWTQNVAYPGAREFFDRYRERTGTSPDYHCAEAYSAVLVAAEALRQANSVRPEKIRAALDATTMMTPFGHVQFYSYHHLQRQNSVPTLVVQVIDGRFQTIWPPQFQTAPFVSSTP